MGNNEVKMLKQIFKNYDKFLENSRKKLLSLLQQKTKESNGAKPLDIDEEIKRQWLNMEEKESVEQKQIAMKAIISLYIKKLLQKSKSKYLQKAYELLDETEDGAYETLDYLNRIPLSNIKSEELKEIYIFKALIYELLEDYDEASSSYKQAIRYDKTPNTLIEFKKFVERTREIFSWNSKEESYKKHNMILLHKVIPIEKMPKVAETVENVAKYYARSPRSRHLGKKYFKEVIKMYKVLMAEEPNKYSCKYIEALLDGIEIFMMSPVILKEVEELLISNLFCIESKIYLLERFKNLKKKKFIQKTVKK